MAKKEEVVKKKISESPEKVEQILVENFVSLQKVMTNLAVKFENLSSQISKLLELFEISAKSLAEKDFSAGDKEMSQKLDNLLEQNKLIARGITMLHEMNQPEEQPAQIPPRNIPQQQRSIPPQQMNQKNPQNQKVQSMMEE